MNYEQLQRMYAGKEYYWGTEPNDFARLGLDFLLRTSEDSGLRAVDIGAGEGRDAVYFAKYGVDTLAIDVAPNGPEKATRLAEEAGVELSVWEGDVNEVELRGPLG